MVKSLLFFKKQNTGLRRKILRLPEMAWFDLNQSQNGYKPREEHLFDAFEHVAAWAPSPRGGFNG
jgi:hypothetical protein